MMPPGPVAEPGRHLESPGSKRRPHNLVPLSVHVVQPHQAAAIERAEAALPLLRRCLDLAG